MCGIAGGYVRYGKVIQEELAVLYENQKERGSQGAGLSIMLPGNEIFRVRDTSPASILNHDFLKNITTGSLFLFHHRLPTSTPNIPECNHPICNEDGTIHLIHNGMLYDDERYIEELRNLGHRFETMIRRKDLYITASGQKYINVKEDDLTDSEIIVHMLEENHQSNSWKEALKGTVSMLSGSIAIAFMIKGVRRIYLYRGANPIVIYRDRFGNLFFSSEFPGARKTKSRFRMAREMRYSEAGVIENGKYYYLGPVYPRDYYTYGAYGEDDLEYDGPRQLDFEGKLFRNREEI